MHRTRIFKKSEKSAVAEHSPSVGGPADRRGVGVLYSLYFVVTVGIISVTYWFSYWRFFVIYAKAAARGEHAHIGMPMIGYVSAIISVTPYLMFLGIAAVYFYFPKKKAYRLSFTKALFHVGIACTPVALNGIALLVKYKTDSILPLADAAVTRVNYFWLNPFFHLLFPPIVMSLPVTFSALMWALLHYSVAWIGFFLIHIKLAQVGKWWPLLILTTWVLVFTIFFARVWVIVPAID